MSSLFREPTNIKSRNSDLENRSRAAFQHFQELGQEHGEGKLSPSSQTALLVAVALL